MPTLHQVDHHQAAERPELPPEIAPLWSAASGASGNGNPHGRHRQPGSNIQARETARPEHHLPCATGKPAMPSSFTGSVKVHAEQAR